MIYQKFKKKKKKKIYNKKLLFAWIVIRFCQMCGIVLTPNCVKSLRKGSTFNFSRADIVEFITVTKCLPILDYYSGMHYFLKGKEEKLPMTKLALMKAAQQKLQNVFMFDFHNMKFDYAIVLFTCLKLNRKSVVDIDFIIEQLKLKLESDDEIHFYYVCAIRWKMILEVKSTQDNDIQLDIESVVKKEQERFPVFKTIRNFFEPVPDDLIFGVGSSLNKVQKEKDIRRVWLQKKYDDQLNTYRKNNQIKVQKEKDIRRVWLQNTYRKNNQINTKNTILKIFSGF